MGETSWFGKRSESELRSIRAETLYEFEMECRSREAGWGDPAFVYDEVRDLFRFTNGRFAFSRKHAECRLLRKRGRLRGMEYVVA